ncbi:MAG: radical SAM protein [Elusimicrobia bacterium]|nr:radical SAM protein [Elusimicrobiota bacterium]
MTEMIIENLQKGSLDRKTIESALALKDSGQSQLFSLARDVRRRHHKDTVELRSVIEISNTCSQDCCFCNISVRSALKRYIIPYDEYVRRIGYLYQAKNRRVFLIQSGENRSQKFVDFIARCIDHTKSNYPDSVIILCLGNLSHSQYSLLKSCGADRYILKFETSDPVLYEKIKPGDTLNERIECIGMLAEIGFEVGSGNIIGLPGQDIRDLVNDLLFIGKFKLTMASASVFIPGEASDFSGEDPGDTDLTLNYMALMRILYPELLIPSTSSLEKSRKGGQYLGLMAGADTLTVHDGTPRRLKKYFPIYTTHRFTPNETFIKRIMKKAGLSSACM